MAGLFIEASPEFWWRDRHRPAVKFLHAEEFPRSRSDFLVLRHRELSADQDFGVKTLLRSIFHGGKPYHFYLLGDDKDRVFCSELVATIYKEAEHQLIPNRDCRDTLPFDLEGIESFGGWVDVTSLYVQAEELSSYGLIRKETPDLREMHLRQYEVSTDIAGALTQLSEAATDFVEHYDAEMSRPITLPENEPPPTYVENIKELLTILKKRYPNYLEIRRYAIDGPVPERMRFDGIESTELLQNLNRVADRLTDLAKMTISVLVAGFKRECERFLAVTTDAEGALAAELSSDVRREHLNKLARHVAAIETYQPESERERGVEVLAEILELMEVMKSGEPPADADPEIMKAFVLCAMMLHVLAIQIEGVFYGVPILKLAQTVAEGSLQTPEMDTAIAPTRTSLREEIADRSALFQKLLAGLKH